jgi:sugar (pentulose or hexulose) kinase
MVTVAAVDLGASSGRVMLGRVSPDEVSLTELRRFANVPVRSDGALRWDILALYQGIRGGLRAAGRVDSLGIDSWGVDYGLLDAAGELVGNPVHYRDDRTAGVLERVSASLGAPGIYATTGIQFLPFNTLYQLAAETAAGRRVLLIPDLIAYWLTGEQGAELTNASTTQLLDIRTRTWATGLMRRAGIDPGLFPPLREPGTRIGDAGSVPVIAVASHDTASAVVAVPAEQEAFAYISCGTWSLVGLELPEPVLTEESRRANFTNELGVDGTIRFLRNVMGLWLLQESLRVWSADLEPLLRAAAQVPAFAAIIDPDDPAFLPPGDMPARITDACRATGQPAPQTPPEFVRCILESLALAHRRTLLEAQRLTGRAVDVVHLVGGGARNTLLCQLTADACGVDVVAGPVEATALGNVLMQARTLGAVPGDLPALRALLRRSQPLTRFTPQGNDSAWHSAQRRLDSAP